jgi:hypothetical protein
MVASRENASHHILVDANAEGQATTERTPPGPASRATVASTCRRRTARSRTAQSYQDRGTRTKCSRILEFAMDRPGGLHYDEMETLLAASNWCFRRADLPGRQLLVRDADGRPGWPSGWGASRWDAQSVT